MNVEDVMRLTADVRRRVRTLLRWGVVSAVDNAGGLQTVQVQTVGDEIRADCVHMQPYGFQSFPKDGAEAIAAAMGGDPAHTVILCVGDRRYRLEGMAQGEVALVTDEGDHIIFRRGGAVEIKGATSLKIDTPTVHLTGDLEVEGSIGVGGDATISGSGGINAPNGAIVGQGTALHSHQHTGVMSGGALTGPPV